MFATMSDAFARIGASFSFAPFANTLQPMIGKVLIEQGKDGYRRGTILTPKLSVWLVLALTLRRDLNYQSTRLDDRRFSLDTNTGNV